MTESEAQNRIAKLLLADAKRMAILRAVANLNLPDCYVAAGFLRNLVWDNLHESTGTPLNDVDVIFFENALTISEEQQKQQLATQMPEYDFDVKNQARMHLKHDHQPYKNSRDAMSYWVELETAVGVRLNKQGDFDYAAPFELALLFDGNITPNPARPTHLFTERMSKKNWLQLWPQLEVKYG